ncbi:hypothetical protein KC946_02875 [Candidatus Saccharibacteria bacterium]|nr:hypothetical protein [Candidatus Saccharibacteria bacterium]
MFNNSSNVVRWFSVVITAVSGVYILVDPWTLTKNQLVILGIILVFVSIMLAGSAKRSWPTFGALTLFGFYLIGRGAGYVQINWFRLVIGPLLIAVSLVHFMQLTAPSDSTKK